MKEYKYRLECCEGATFREHWLRFYYQTMNSVPQAKGRNTSTDIFIEESNRLLERFHGYNRREDTYITFETEEDMLAFILAYSE